MKGDKNQMEIKEKTTNIFSSKNIITFIETLLTNKSMFIFIVMSLIAGALSPNFFTQTNIFNVLRQVAAATVLGMGYSLVLGSGNIDLSVGFMMGLLGIISAILDKIIGLPFYQTILITAFCGILCGLFNALTINILNLPPFILTLASGQIFKGINYVISNTTAISVVSQQWKVIGQGYIGIVPIPVYIAIIVTLIITIIIYKTSFGRHIIIVGGNPEAARVSGLDVKRIRIGVYCLMGLLTAVASMIITGRALSSSPQSGQGMEMDAIAAAVIGGTPLGGGYSRPEGTFFGCLIVGLINNILNLLAVNTNWQLAAKGAIIILAITLDSQSEKILQRLRLKAKL